MGFRRATRKKAKLRLGLVGPTGSGKTYTALLLADTLAAGGSIAVLDTERGSASLYSHLTAFDVVELSHFSVEDYIKWIEEAAEDGYPVLVIDSLSHAWAGKGGILEFVDETAKKKGGGGFSAWRDATPKHNELIDAILSYPGHVICTMRSKMEHVQEKDERTGKTVVKKIGMQPIQRDGMEYEFTVVGDMTQDHELLITKTRCEKIDGKVIKKPGRKLAETLLGWLDEGDDPEKPLRDALLVAKDMETDGFRAHVDAHKHLGSDHRALVAYCAAMANARRELPFEPVNGQREALDRARAIFRRAEVDDGLAAAMKAAALGRLEREEQEMDRDDGRAG